MCTAPVITSFGGGTCTVRNTLPRGVSSVPLLPLRMRFSSTSASGSRATSAALTRRCSPVASLVTTMTARRAARSLLSTLRISSFTTPSLHLLHKHPDRPAAPEPDLPRGLVGDAEFQRLGLAALDHVERFGHPRALDAAAGDRAEKIALVVDHEVRADRPRRRAPGLHHRGERHPAPLLAPVLGGLEDVFVGCEHLTLRILTIPRMPMTSWPGCPGHSCLCAQGG